MVTMSTDVVTVEKLEESKKEKRIPATGFHTNPERINRNGRPKKGNTWSDILEKIGEEIDPETKKPYREAVSRVLWKECAKGNVAAIKELMNRMDGLPTQHNENENYGELVVTFRNRIE